MSITIMIRRLSEKSRTPNIFRKSYPFVDEIPENEQAAKGALFFNFVNIIYNIEK